MKEIPKKRQAKETQKKRWKPIIVLLAGASTIISMLILIKYRPRPKQDINITQSSISVGDEELIREGDLEFKAYRYTQALGYYLAASARLSSQIEFEKNAPSKNDKLLQHYYNMETFLQARIELTSIIEKVSRSTPSSSKQPSPTANKSKP